MPDLNCKLSRMQTAQHYSLPVFPYIGDTSAKKIIIRVITDGIQGGKSFVLATVHQLHCHSLGNVSHLTQLFNIFLETITVLNRKNAGRRTVKASDEIYFSCKKKKKKKIGKSRRKLKMK